MRRWPWLVSVASLVASAAAAAGSVGLHWQPCLAGRGSDACLARMDSSLPFPALSDASQEVPWASEFGVVVAMLLAAVSLVPVLVAAKVPPRSRLILAATVVHPMLLGGFSLYWALGGGIPVFTFLPPQPADFRTILPEPVRT